ncbi:MAG: hypothetical protein CMC37_02805 [Flavobacteriaceae bacterium]|nr:hypothetical protein [Flavobacteriaceae bacterium]|tara:strand:- start:423 stop:1250 length:828 start_codon:yes stop_codon:yes gene_type:complete
MKRSKYLILIILLGFSSCALKKEYVIGDNKRLTAKKIVKIINENEHDIKTFQARARIDYFRKNKVKTNTATIRILSGEKIWISAPLGAIRLLITNDSIKYYNKLERNYIKTSFAYIENIIGLNITYEMLEKLLFGQPVLALNPKDFAKKLNMENSQYEDKLRSYIFKKLIDYEGTQLQGLFYVNPYNFKLNSQKFFDYNDKTTSSIGAVSNDIQKTFSINYKAYNSINKHIYPRKILFLDWDNKSINIDMKSVIIDKKLNIPFRIPKGYSQVIVD